MEFLLYFICMGKKKLTTEEFIERARKVHGDKYDYSKVEYVNTETKVCIICPIHGEFWQSPHSHLNGIGCKYCAYSKNSEIMKYTLEEFLKRARKIHGDKYDYSKTIYENCDKKTTIICKIHGEFLITPNNHLHGHGCPKCSRKHHYTNEEWIALARQVHGDKYDYSKVEYKSAKEKVCIICPTHGEFWQMPSNHLHPKHPQECPLCYLEGRIKTTEQFIEDAKQVHGDKYDYSKSVYEKNNKKLCIICPTHGEFWQTPHCHLGGRGCPKCSESKYEKYIMDYLLAEKIFFEHRKHFNWLEQQHLDFYLPEYNIAIECQGEQHFRPVDFGNKGSEWSDNLFETNKARDYSKITKCKENNVKLIHYNPFEEYFGTYENEIHDTKELEKILITT